MKGIILAGGSGTRLYPLTLATSKQLLPIYDKPMIYYPLSVLMMAEIRDILIISTAEDLSRMEKLLGDGRKFGLRFTYCIQPSPDGLAQAFLLGEDFIGDDSCAMVLGDNIFHGAGLIQHLKNSNHRAEEGIATIYGYYVKNPERFGIVEMDENNNAVSIEEKPEKPKSNYCVTGLYFYPPGVCQKAKMLKPSKRGELEITDLNNLYLKEKKLHVTTLGRGYAWLDCGTHESLFFASEYVRLLEERQGIKVCCPEEIAYKNGWISKATLVEQGVLMQNNAYGKHLLNVAENRIKY